MPAIETISIAVEHRAPPGTELYQRLRQIAFRYFPEDYPMEGRLPDTNMMLYCTNLGLERTNALLAEIVHELTAYNVLILARNFPFDQPDTEIAKSYLIAHQGVLKEMTIEEFHRLTPTQQELPSFDALRAECKPQHPQLQIDER